MGRSAVTALPLPQPMENPMTKIKQLKSISKEQRSTLQAAPRSIPAQRRTAKKSRPTATTKAAAPRKPGKIDKVIAMMRRPKGASIAFCGRIAAKTDRYIPP
jgi:hypothetical protein